MMSVVVPVSVIGTAGAPAANQETVSPWQPVVGRIRLPASGDISLMRVIGTADGPSENQKTVSPWRPVVGKIRLPASGDILLMREVAEDKPDAGVQLEGDPPMPFFEGDLARIVAGFANEANTFDLPFAFGLIPLLLQDDSWLTSALASIGVMGPAEGGPPENQETVSPPPVVVQTTQPASGDIALMREVKKSSIPAAKRKPSAPPQKTMAEQTPPKVPFSFGLLVRRIVYAVLAMDPRARLVPNNEHMPFSPDPVYTKPYDPEAQLAIYGAKHPNPTTRPLLEAGRELYGPGTFQPGINLLGNKNLIFPQLLIYGDFRTALAYNDNGAIEKGIFATRLNLDVDFKLTGTERFHLFVTPLNRANQFTRVEFAGNKLHSGVQLDGDPQALFFEGDLARIYAGLTDQENLLDIPFTFGLIPLLFQNGVWLNDAFTGFAFTIPARNSPHFGISNADITFFAAFDQVTTGAIPNDHSADVFGIATFVEARGGYFEFDYGYTLGRKDFSDLSYHNFSAAFTRRYFDTVSNSVRVIYNFGQEPDAGHRRTADGVLLLIENSLVSHLPLTLVPYLNLFAGFNKPQSLARAGAAGGVLVNTGILFETDNLTGFPKMDDTGHNTYGGSIGIEYLFDLHQQIVFEISALEVFGDAKDRTANGAQVGFGVRYQLPLNNAWLLRADGIVAARQNDDDLIGARVELRRKF